MDYKLDCFQSYLKHSSLQRSCSFQGVPFEDSLQKKKRFCERCHAAWVFTKALIKDNIERLLPEDGQVACILGALIAPGLGQLNIFDPN